MRLVTFNSHRIGVLDADTVYDVTSLVPGALAAWPRMRMTWLIRTWSEARAQAEKLVRETEGVPLASVRLGAPQPAPPHIFALPANFRAHIGELGSRVVTPAGRSAREQGFFLKAPGSIIGPEDAIELPKGSVRRFDHECELGVVIGADARDVPRDKAMEVVFGYTCLIDLTMRIEKGEHEEERSMRKSFAGFTPIGPHIVTADEISDLSSLTSRLLVNDAERQAATLRDMIVDVPEAVELVSSVMSLQAGDIIAMGTPQGVGPIAPGDEIEIAIDRIGQMRLGVVEREVVSPRAY